MHADAISSIMSFSSSFRWCLLLSLSLLTLLMISFISFLMLTLSSSPFSIFISSLISLLSFSMLRFLLHYFRGHYYAADYCWLFLLHFFLRLYATPFSSIISSLKIIFITFDAIIFFAIDFWWCHFCRASLISFSSFFFATDIWCRLMLLPFSSAMPLFAEAYAFAAFDICALSFSLIRRRFFTIAPFLTLRRYAPIYAPLILLRHAFADAITMLRCFRQRSFRHKEAISISLWAPFSRHYFHMADADMLLLIMLAITPPLWCWYYWLWLSLRAIAFDADTFIIDYAMMLIFISSP